jgi:hypothetical protein
MRICLDLGGVFYPGASDEDNVLALQFLLEALIGINQLYLRRQPGTPKLYNSGVRYARTVVWDSIPDLLTRRVGDCKSLSAMRVAELRNQGQQARPVFRFANNPQTGTKDFHILVQQGKAFDDPSKKLGMVQYHASQGLWLSPSW